jgi:hypothetical protein
VAIAGASAVLVDQFGRLLGRRAREHRTHEQLELAPIGAIDTVEAAAIDTVEAAVRGYTAAPRSETVLFNLLGGFLGSFALVRLSTYGIRERWGPFRNVSIGGRHIHHFVPGILLAFGSGIAALVSDNDELEQTLALPMGAGIGLTFDEAALLLDLRDVYWTREGLLSVQLSLGATAILSIAIVTLRMLRRGEAQLLEDADAAARPQGHAGALA